MGNSTWSGPMRVLEDPATAHQVISRNADTGVETVVDRLSHVGYATGVTVNTTAGDSPAIGQFTQPANTIITAIDLWCVLAPTTGSGDIGFEVGTTSSGAQIVAADTNGLIATGTTVVINAVAQLTLVQVTQSATTFVVSAQYAGAERTIYCNVTNTVDATTAGSFTFVIRYVTAPQSNVVV